jgi:hypothetical protein
MRLTKYFWILAIVLVCVTSCRDESLYPLPYNDRDFAAYLRMYSIASNVLNINDPANSGFETEFEIVDKEGGNQLESINFYATFRKATGDQAVRGITDEVFVKNIPAAGLFEDVPEPTYSEYKRATIRITYNETLAALATAPTQTGTEFWPSLARKISMPVPVAADQVVYRWQIVMKDGSKYTVNNPQGTIPAQANMTVNITGGQYYSSPFQFTMTLRTLPAGAYTGTYQLDQIAIWSPNHSVAIHASSYPAYMREEVFESGQTVTLSVPTEGLSTQRELNVTYRGQTSRMLLNFEQSDPLLGQAAANITAALTTVFAPAAAQTGARGTVFVQLQDSGADCSPERGLYWVTPIAGLFGSTAAASTNPATTPLGTFLPKGVMPSRGFYLTGSNGTTPGDVFFIAVDDDADEYGRRNGYCTWTRRVYLKLTKL